MGIFSLQIDPELSRFCKSVPGFFFPSSSSAPPLLPLLLLCRRRRPSPLASAPLSPPVTPGLPYTPTRPLPLAAAVALPPRCPLLRAPRLPRELAGRHLAARRSGHNRAHPFLLPFPFTSTGKPSHKPDHISFFFPLHCPLLPPRNTELPPPFPTGIPPNRATPSKFPGPVASPPPPLAADRS